MIPTPRIIEEWVTVRTLRHGLGDGEALKASGCASVNPKGPLQVPSHFRVQINISVACWSPAKTSNWMCQPVVSRRFIHLNWRSCFKKSLCSWSSPGLQKHYFHFEKTKHLCCLFNKLEKLMSYLKGINY